MLYFDVQNFRVFRDEALLDLRANKRNTKFNDNLLDQVYKIKEKVITEKVLPYSVIYGNNAAGKSSLVKAMALLKNIILSGKIFADSSKELLNSLSIFPYLHDYKKYTEPMKLAIGFIYAEKKYEFVIKIKCSLSRNDYFYADRDIVEEQLFINDESVYYRDSETVKFENKKIKIGAGADEEHITNEELFLYSQFKISDRYHTDFQNIVNWFRYKFYVIDDISHLKTVVNVDAPLSNNHIDIRNKIIDAVTHISDFGPQSIFYRLNSTDGESSSEMRAHYKINGHPNRGFDTPAYKTESTGTLLLVNLSMFLVDSLKNGNTVVIDEFDSSLHFELVKEIVNLYADNEINIGKGQIVFTSHNPSFVALVNIRRDQIYLVEKDKETYSSILYSLADFPSENVRTSEAFIKNYLRGKYGALSSFDLSNEIRTAMKFLQETK